MSKTVEVPQEWIEDVKKYVANMNHFLWWIRIWVPAAAVSGVVIGLIMGWLLWGMPA